MSVIFCRRFAFNFTDKRLTLGLTLWQWPMFEALLRNMIETKGLR